MTGLPPIGASHKRKREEVSHEEGDKVASAIPCLPDDLFMHALSFLSAEDLARASGVCREWNRLSSDLWKELDLKKICSVIDQEVWKKHVDLAALGLDASGAPAIDKCVVIPFIKRLSKQVEGNAGVTLLTMPKGLTLNKLIALAAVPKQGPATRFKQFGLPTVFAGIADMAIDKTHILAITNSVLKESRKLSIKAQRVLVHENGGELPMLLSVATLAFLTFISAPQQQSPAYLYSWDPRVLTRIAELSNRDNIVVGAFNWQGLNVFYQDISELRAEDIGAGVAKLL